MRCAPLAAMAAHKISRGTFSCRAARSKASVLLLLGSRAIAPSLQLPQRHFPNLPLRSDTPEPKTAGLPHLSQLWMKWLAASKWGTRLYRPLPLAISCVGTAAAAPPVWRTGEPAAYPRGRSCRRRSRGVPRRSSATVSREPSPIERTRRQSVSPRQASREQVVLNPAATNFRHSSSTGAYPRALRPSASQRFEPMSVAQIGACESCFWRLISATTCRPSRSLFEAPSAATAPGLLLSGSGGLSGGNRLVSLWRNR